MSLASGIACSLAALGGGIIDAVSGGGGLLTMPALLLAGVPPHIALGTNKVSACCGTTIALLNFARHRLVNWSMALYGVLFSIAGSFFGAWLALKLDSALLGKILVILLPFAMTASLMPPKKREGAHLDPVGWRFWALLPLVCFTIGVYDGFFGPGTGIFIILGLHWLLKTGLMEASATAKALNLGSNVSAAISFVWADAIYWPLAILMGGCFIVGNWLGSAIAIKIGDRIVKKFLLFSLVLLMASLVWRFFMTQ